MAALGEKGRESSVRLSIVCRGHRQHGTYRVPRRQKKRVGPCGPALCGDLGRSGLGRLSGLGGFGLGVPLDAEPAPLQFRNQAVVVEAL